MLEFFTLKPETFGLDVSDLSLKMIKLKKKSDSLSLASFCEAEISPGMIESGEIKDEDGLADAIKEALRKTNKEKLRTRYVIASLPEEKAFIRVIQMPAMEEKELKKAVYFEAENYVPLPLDKVYLDSQAIPRSDKKSERSAVLIAALPKEIVDSYLSVFRKAGLKPLAFEVESQAIARALVKRGREDCSALLIDLGAVRTGLSFFSGNSLRFTSSVPALSDSFSKDELAEQIKKHLDYYRTRETEPINEALLCGGKANLKDLPEFLSRELKIRASLGNPWINILPETLKEIPEISFEESLKYATALGLALYDKSTADKI